MSDLLLLTGALEPAPEILPSLGLLLHSVRVAPPEVPVLADAPPARRHPGGRPAGPGPGQEPVPAAAHGEPGRPATGRSHRGRPGRGDRRLGRRRRDFAHCRAGRGGGQAAAGHRPQGQPGPGRPGRDPLRRPGHRRGDLHGPAAGPRPRPDVQGIRAAEVPGPAPGPGVHPGPPAPGGLGLRLLRRHPHGGRARAAAAGQARHRARGADRHRPQRGLPVRPGQGQRRGAGPAVRPARSPDQANRGVTEADGLARGRAGPGRRPRHRAGHGHAAGAGAWPAHGPRRRRPVPHPPTGDPARPPGTRPRSAR